MYTKILLVIIIVILSSFFYLHTRNPGLVTFVVTKDYTYVMPVTLLVFVGFFAGVILAVGNSLLVDAKRAINEMRGRREKKLLADAEENYKKGIDALVKGNTGAAREFIEKSLKARPYDTGKVITLSETYIRENRTREALKLLEDAAINNPASVGILITLTRCAIDIGEAARAAKALEDVLAIDPKNPYALKKLREMRIAEKKWSEAARLQKTIFESEPDGKKKEKERAFLTGLLFESASLLAREGELNKALVQVKEVLKNDDAFMPAHVLLGDILFSQGNAPNAVKVWEKAMAKYPDPEPLLLRLEDLFIKESAPERIIETYKREISSRPEDPNLRLLLSRLYLRLEMVDDAIEELERLYQDGEDSLYSQVLLGTAYFRRKQGGKAAHLFHKALGLEGEFAPSFVCACGARVKSWGPRCSGCGQWNTLLMENAERASKSAPAAAKI